MSRFVGLLGLALVLVTVGCGDDDAGDAAGADGGGEADALPEAVAAYAKIVLASYEDTRDAALELDSAIADLTDDPSEATLEAARDAWRAAREPYLQTEPYRFYNGPIDEPENGPEGLINSWPLDEDYIDYVDGDPEAGIVNDTSIEISADELATLNDAGGEKDIATGYHAIEFLLWGQDHSDDGPGDRPYTDFVDGGTAENQDRRREYLTALSSLLVDELQGLVDAWAAGEDNYRAQFEALPPDQALERILTGLIVLTGFETGGERLQTALDTADQEDEHSCFSDNTHRDMVQDVRGMQNVYLGRYQRSDGSSVRGGSIEAVVAAKDDALAQRVKDRIAESLELAEALQPPFDQEIKLDNPDGRERVTALVESLRTQEDDLIDVFTAFDLSVPEPE
jgi:putative iron-regulated protein